MSLTSKVKTFYLTKSKRLIKTLRGLRLKSVIMEGMCECNSCYENGIHF